MAVDFVDGCHVVLLWSFLSGSGSSVDTGVQHVLSVATGRKAPKCRVLCEWTTPWILLILTSIQTYPSYGSVDGSGTAFSRLPL